MLFFSKVFNLQMHLLNFSKIYQQTRHDNALKIVLKIQIYIQCTAINIHVDGWEKLVNISLHILLHSLYRIVLEAQPITVALTK